MGPARPEVDAQRTTGQRVDCPAARGRFIRPITKHGALERLPHQARAPVADPRELAAPRIPDPKPTHETKRDLGSSPRERGPRAANVDLASDEPRPADADLGGQRGVRLGRACLVTRAQTARCALAATLGHARHAAFCSTRRRAASTSRSRAVGQRFALDIKRQPQLAPTLSRAAGSRRRT